MSRKRKGQGREAEYPGWVRVGEDQILSADIVERMQAAHPGGMEAEARQTLDNIRTTLDAHGYAMKDLIKCTVMLADMDDWGAFNQIYQSYFQPPYPARSAFGANGLALGARVELECIAAIPS